MDRSPLAGRQPKTRFSKWLRDNNISSDWLAHQTGFSRKTIDGWRGGYRTPGTGALQLLCLRLGLERSKLLRLLKN